MIFIHVDGTSNNAEKINKYIDEGKHVFILFYMEGCGPCNATRPEWKKLETVLQHKYKNNNNIVVADIDQEELKKIKHLPKEPSGFPTMLYIHKNGSGENYEESSYVKDKNRTVDSFVEWIEGNVPSLQTGGKKRRWSMKYKKSINCKRPRGFSQRQYCKYGRKKTKRTIKRK